LPFRIENNCFSNINFNYTWQQNGYKVVQRCNYENGEISVSTGDLQFSSNPTIADFKLSYLPFLFSWLPFAKTEYIILYTDYSNYAIIGSSDLNNLWLLSRKQDNSSAEIQKLIDIVKQYNYPLQKLIFSNLAFNLK
jgi:apolipoprotein D and lipocalin family protein